MPLIVCTARKIAPTGSSPPVPRSSSSSEWLMAETCSRLSVRKSSAYWALSTRVSCWEEGSGPRAAATRREPGTRTRAEGECGGWCEATLGASPQNALHCFENSAGLERFDHEVLRARLDRLDDQRLLPHGA